MVSEQNQVACSGGMFVSRLSDLIAKAKAENAQLGADLEREFRALSSRLSFGLNFERHRPEAVELPQRPIRRGDKVRILPERGSTKKGDPRLCQVLKITKSGKTRQAELRSIQGTEESCTASLDDLVVIAEFGDTIYPGLVSTGKVSRGGDRPWHTVINAENYHALKALTWTHRGKVDAIYIDPPYNTGAKDWKYNNDYVEGEDLYRHSKWLAMMERRLLIAKQLLNPADSVLIVTIDEKEYLRLGLLLEQVFPEAQIQMISSVIKPEGTNRTGEFSRTNEYIYFVMFGSARVVAGTDDMSGREQAEKRKKRIEWRNLRRREHTSVRTARPNQFYAVFVDPAKGAISGVGDPLPPDVGRQSVSPPEGSYAVFPLKPDGTEMLWGLTPQALRDRLRKGFARVSKADAGPEKVAIQYLARGTVKAIASGEVTISGRDAQGAVQGAFEEVATMPKTTWNKRSHNAQTSGTLILSALIPGRKFPFPKSLYAVEDSLRFFVSGKPGAVILDFFAGSGTTAHAVMRLNRQDNGRRQCISVTNNEVAADEQKALREQELRPGDPEWEKWGICDYITKPRVEAAITGKTPDGKPIKGDYKFTDEFPMADGFEANAEFFTLTYETPVAVNYQTAFARIAPLLWLRAGSEGSRIDKLPKDGWAVADTYGLLADLDAATDFLKAARKADGLRIAYIVTDDERRFQAIARRLPDGVEPIRLYESYLTNFAFTNGESN